MAADEPAGTQTTGSSPASHRGTGWVLIALLTCLTLGIALWLLASPEREISYRPGPGSVAHRFFGEQMTFRSGFQPSVSVRVGEPGSAEVPLLHKTKLRMAVSPTRITDPQTGDTIDVPSLEEPESFRDRLLTGILDHSAMPPLVYRSAGDADTLRFRARIGGARMSIAPAGPNLLLFLVRGDFAEVEVDSSGSLGGNTSTRSQAIIVSPIPYVREDVIAPPVTFVVEDFEPVRPLPPVDSTAAFMVALVDSGLVQKIRFDAAWVQLTSDDFADTSRSTVEPRVHLNGIRHAVFSQVPHAELSVGAHHQTVEFTHDLDVKTSSREGGVSEQYRNGRAEFRTRSRKVMLMGENLIDPRWKNIPPPLLVLLATSVIGAYGWTVKWLLRKNSASSRTN